MAGISARGPFHGCTLVLGVALRREVFGFGYAVSISFRYSHLGGCGSVGGDEFEMKRR